jgi:import receptor subunit TOM70
MEDCEKAVLLGCSKQYEAQALNLKGTMAFLKGDAQVALDCFNRSVIIDPSYVQIYIKLASLFMERHDITAALEQFDLAISLNPNDPDIYYHRGQGSICHRVEEQNQTTNIEFI